MSDDAVVFLNGGFVPLAEARISPEDRGFLFADGVYESIRYYPSPPGGIGVLFELERHLQRLRASLDEIRLRGVDVDALGAVLPELIRRNGLEGSPASIYVQVTRGVAPRTHVFPDASTPPTVYARTRYFDPPIDAWQNGAAAATIEDQRWGRCDVKTIALLANVLASEDARRAGAREAIFVHDGVVTEGSHTTVAFVRDGILRTHPSGKRILPSVTREVVLRLCGELGVPVEERAVAVQEFSRLDEAFVMGTTTEIMPVTTIDGRPVGDGRVGPITRRIQDAYFALHP